MAVPALEETAEAASGNLRLFRMFLGLACIFAVFGATGALYCASFWLVAGILSGVVTMAIGWLGILTAMLALDCLPEGGTGAIRRNGGAHE